MHYSKNRRAAKPAAPALATQSNEVLQAKVMRLSKDLGIAHRFAQSAGHIIDAHEKTISDLTRELRAQKVCTSEAVEPRRHSDYTKGKMVGAGFTALAFVLMHYLTNVAW